MPINLGLCCLNTELRKKKIFTSRTVRFATFEKIGFEAVKKLSMENLDDLEKMLHWNKENGISVFRMSSEMFPHISNLNIFNIDYDAAMEYYKLEWCKDRLKQIGDLAKELDIRLTFHPGQYNQLGSPKKDVVNKTLVDLEWHCKVLDLMECDEQSIVVLHGGGMFESKKNTLARIEETYNNLPERIKRRIVLENCEKCYSVEDLLPLCKKNMIPLVYDTHHYTCYAKLHPNEKQKPMEDLLPEVLMTWSIRGIKPKFHISEQGSGRIGHHSDYIEVIPEHLIKLSKSGGEFDLMVEAKMKEQAIIKLRGIYPDACC